ncbi:MAG: autotransporter-associated beta strand repeat-containing protein, partial [Pirellulales bacterium]
FIEINPNYSWYADPYPLTDDEFSPDGVQKLASGLTSAEQANFFAGSTPPGSLETGYHREGMAGPIGPGGFDAASGYDLLTVVVHEMGHVLGINSAHFPPKIVYGIDSQFLGGTGNALVAAGAGGHLAGDDETPGYLMCDHCATAGGRYYPSATDVLAIAGANGMSDVYLQRLGSITGGQWHTASNWIGADVPDISQSAYIQHGGTVTLGADAAAKDVTVGNNSSLIIGDRILSSPGIFNFAGSTTVSIDAGGILYANQIVRGNSDLVTAVGSRVEFNSYSGGGNAPATFAGSVGIGTGSAPPAEIEFDPTTIPTWTIRGELSVGVARSAHFVIDNSMDVTSGTGQVGSGSAVGTAGRVSVNGGGSSWMVIGTLRVSNGTLSVSNSAQVRSASADIGTSNGIANVDINGGFWDVDGNIDVGPTLAGSSGGGDINIRNLGSLRADGNLVLRGTPSRSSDITLYSRGSLEIDGGVTVHPYSKITFRDNSYAHSGALGTETYENLGGNNSDPIGGLIQFFDSSTSGNSQIINRPGNAQFAGGAETRFYDNAIGGRTLFSGKTRIDNYGATASYFSGATRFFGNSNGGDSDYFNHPGAGLAAATIEFNDDSNAGNGTYTNLAIAPGLSTGGMIIFNHSARAGNASFVNQSEVGVVQFNNNTSADHATFNTADNTGGNSRLLFFGSSTAASANFALGANTYLQFYESATAANATINIRRGGFVDFSGSYNIPGNPTCTAGDAQIVLEGSSLLGFYGAHAGFSTWSTAGNATITAHGGTVFGAGGADISFDYVGRAGNATLIAKSGANGGAGGVIYFRRGAKGDTARIVVEQGALADFGGNRKNIELGYDGTTTVGSIEGAGTFALNGSELRTGTRNTDTTVSGPIVDALGTNFGGQLTKIGTGKLTLGGTNTYTGLTTVSSGSLFLNGSVVGDVQVAAGATFGGSGVVGGNLNVADGAILAPGNSPGTLRAGSLTLNPASILNFEFGVVSDLMIVAGDVTLDGVLNILPGLGFDAFGEEIITYSGTLTNHGLTIGSVPTGFTAANFQLDFSTPGEIHLLGPTETVPGDYNFNGIVDAGDYNVWRDKFGSAASLPNDDTPGVGNDDYTRWKTHFGQSGGGAAEGLAAAAPEPATLSLLMLLAPWCAGSRRPKRSSSIR